MAFMSARNRRWVRLLRFPLLSSVMATIFLIGLPVAVGVSEHGWTEFLYSLGALAFIMVLTILGFLIVVTSFHDRVWINCLFKMISGILLYTALVQGAVLLFVLAGGFGE